MKIENKLEKIADYVFSDEGQKTIIVKSCNVMMGLALISAIWNPSALIIAGMMLALKITAKN